VRPGGELYILVCNWRSPGWAGNWLEIEEIDSRDCDYGRDGFTGHSHHGLAGSWLETSDSGLAGDGPLQPPLKAGVGVCEHAMSSRSILIGWFCGAALHFCPRNPNIQAQ
jgi:hypothetical protein